MDGISQGGECCAQEARPQGQVDRGRQLAEAPTPTGNNPKIRSINIEQLDLGYVVRVGCQSFAIETADKLLLAMAEYLKSPAEVEKKWFEGKFLK